MLVMRYCKGGDTRETYANCRWCGQPLGIGGHMCLGSPEQQEIDRLQQRMAHLETQLSAALTKGQCT